MSITFDFTGRVVIVTGAARGVGRVMARAFAAAGASVVAADRDEPGLAETCAGMGDSVAPVVADISTPDGAQAIVAAAIDRFGQLDVCVNNAAVAPHAALLAETAEVWDRVYAVNCRGTFLMTQAAARAMIASSRTTFTPQATSSPGAPPERAPHARPEVITRGDHQEAGPPIPGHSRPRSGAEGSLPSARGQDAIRAGGRIINFSSGVSQRGSAGAAAYASSRAAVESLSRVAAIELAPHNILVNTVSPGLIDTQPKPLPPLMAENLQKRIPNLPLARPGEPDEVAALVMFLASDAASYISGAVFCIDGASGVGARFGGQVVDVDPRYNWVTGRNV